MSLPPTRLRVVHYLHTVSLADGGVVRAVLDLCSTLANRGHDVTLACANGVDAPSEWKVLLPNEPLGRSPRLVELSTGVRFHRDITPCIEAAQVVHLHVLWDVYSLSVAYLARKLRKPYVLTVHGVLDDWSMSQKRLKKRVYHALFARRLLERAAFVHCTAQAELEQAQPWFSRAPGVVLPYVVNFSPFLTLPGPEPIRRRFPFLANDRLKLLFLSRLHHKKGAEVLIDAAALLKEQGQDFTLVIAGAGEDSYVRTLEQRIERLGLGYQTHLVGLITGVEKLSLFQACDLFVLPTSQENFGLVLTEAMACETPVLTTRGTDIWREIEAGGGIICDAEPGVLATTIRELAADREALAKRGRRAREWVMRFFEQNGLLAAYESLYGDAICRANVSQAVEDQG